MNAKHRVLLVGAGSMGTNHARVIAQSSRAELSMLVDPRQSVGSTIAERHGAKWSPEIPDLSEIDIVVVAAATEAHYAILIDLLSADKPILVEKPVTPNIQQTEEILALAEARDIPFMCGLLERFNPAVLTARKLLSQPLHVTATRHSPYAPRIQTGVAWDLLVHDVDLAIQIMGEVPTALNAQLGFYHPDSLPDAEDVAEALLNFNGGGIAQVSASRISQRKLRKLSVYEYDKLVEVDLVRRDVTLYHHVSEDSVAEGLGYRQQTIIEIPELVSSQEPLTAQFNHLLDIVEGKQDAAAERASILPPHSIIDRIVAQRQRAPR